MPDPHVAPELVRYLLPRERLVADVHWHVIWLLRPTLLVTGLLTLLGWVAAGLPDHSVLGPWLPLVFLGLIGWYGWKYLSWRHDRLLVTDRRVLLIQGLLSRKVGVMPLKKVTDMTYEQPLVGRLFDRHGWGTFVFESAGQHQAFHRIPFLPHPDDLYRRLTDTLFGHAGGAGRRVSSPSDDDE